MNGAPDLIVASTEDIEGQPTVAPELNFQHALTHIKFRTASSFPIGKMEKAVFENFYRQAELPLDGKMEWD